MPTSGIYSISNVRTGKIYYGSSNDIETRIRVHKSKLKGGNHANPHLQNSWNKYGEENFRFEIIENVSIVNLQFAEQSYLDWCKIFPRWSYNIGYDATCATRGLKFGTPSKEHRRKISEAKRGSKSPNFGKKFSDETRRKMSISKTGVAKPPRTDEHKKNLSLACRGCRDKTIYTFVHPLLGIEKCNRDEIISKYKLHKRGVGMLIEKKRKSCKQWRIHG